MSKPDSINNVNNSSVMAARDPIIGYALQPASLGKFENELIHPVAPPVYAVADDNAVRDAEASALLMVAKFGDFAQEKMIGFTPGLQRIPFGDIYVAGGVCALSTRESEQASNGVFDDAEGGQTVPISDIDQYLESLDAISATQVFEAIGQVAARSLVVLEDELWAENVNKKLRRSTRLDVEADQIDAAVKKRNTRAFEALARLREFLIPGAPNLVAIRDTEVMPELKPRTDNFLDRLDLPIEPMDTYRFVYAGMYSGVWREVLETAGVIADADTLAIYEPTKHLSYVGAYFTAENRFRQAMFKREPFLQAGSFNEKVGLMAYLEPIFPNGARFRDFVPMQLVPNSQNYRDFDFSKFPILPNKASKLVPLNLFMFSDNVAELSLSDNPAFLWGSMFPPTPQLRTGLREMATVTQQCRVRAKAATRDTVGGEQKKQLSTQIRSAASSDMGDVAQQVMTELRRITVAMFEATENGAAI